MLVIRREKTDRIIKAYKTKQPKMTNHRGRTWDEITIVIDGEEVKTYLDTTWGWYFYVEYKGEWHKFPVGEFDDWGYKEKFTLEKFNNKVYYYTKP
jgi:hypothetical protein